MDCPPWCPVSRSGGRFRRVHLRGRAGRTEAGRRASSIDPEAGHAKSARSLGLRAPLYRLARGRPAGYAGRLWTTSPRPQAGGGQPIPSSVRCRLVDVLRTLLCLGIVLGSMVPGTTSGTAPAAPTRRVDTTGAPPPQAAAGYAAPVAPVVVLRPFTPPVTVYGPGHLGVDLRTTARQVVLAARDGVVMFAGQVAGRGVVVLSHPDGLHTEYEPVLPLVVRGATVRRGEPIARVAGRHPGCLVPCLHWGARSVVGYVDPLRLLRPLEPVRLLPWPRPG